MTNVDAREPELAPVMVENQAFEEMFLLLYPQARTLAFRILGSLPAAEDAAAEAFVRAFADWHRVGHLPYRDAWIMRVATNMAIDMARRSPPQPTEPPPGHDLEDQVALRATLVTALAVLPRRQREAVILRHFAGYPAHDVASAMGVSENSVKTHLQRGLVHLRRTMPLEEGADHEII